MFASHAPRTGDLVCNPGMCPNWELNWGPFGLQARTQSTEPHQQGSMNILSGTCGLCSKTLDGAFFIIMLHHTALRRQYHDSSLKCVGMKDGGGASCWSSRADGAQTPV